MDRTLAILQDIMSAHRDALAGTPEAAPPAAAADPRLQGPLRPILRLVGAIEQRCGIDVSSQGIDKLVRRLDAMPATDIDSWVSRLETLPWADERWLALIEAVTVHETYVMRDRSQLDLFASMLPGVIAEAQAAGNHALRFWSAGCSTGEEAYSIAAIALDGLVQAGHATATPSGTSLHPPWRLEVVGSDISRAALDRARAGIYDVGPLSSFRDGGAPPSRYFPRAPGSAGRRGSRTVHPDLRSAVRFVHGNLVAADAWTPPCDAVFCRNVLMYFSEDGRRRALDSLSRAVRPGGCLVLGPTDSPIQTDPFDALWGNDAMIYRRRPGHA